jgi:hypothetical protein
MNHDPLPKIAKCHCTMRIMMAEDKSIIFNNILVLTEVSVKSHMKVKVILRLT